MHTHVVSKHARSAALTVLLSRGFLLFTRTRRCRCCRLCFVHMASNEETNRSKTSDKWVPWLNRFHVTAPAVWTLQTYPGELRACPRVACSLQHSVYTCARARASIFSPLQKLSSKWLRRNDKSRHLAWKAHLCVLWRAYVHYVITSNFR